MRGTITGLGTAVGGMFHTLPFLMSNLQTALAGGAIVFFIGLWLGRYAAGG
jgi:hypothetical protein